jgi:multiple sugar transport system permease protein
MKSGGKMSKNRKLQFGQDNKTGYLMILPYYFAYLFLCLIPIVVVLILSLCSYNFTDFSFVGLRNFVNMTKDGVFSQAIKNTLVYGLFTVIPVMVMGLILANWLNSKVLFQKYFRLAIFSPYVISMVAVSMIWLWMYDPSLGVFNIIMKAFGFETKKWLMDPSLALPCLIIMGIWKGIGYNMIIYLAGLQGISGELYEAAKVDGATPLQSFIKITVPLLKPTTFFLFVTGCIDSFKVFEQVNIMTDGGPINATTTIVHQIYYRAFLDMNMGYACAEAMALFLFVVIITICNYGLGSKSANADFV